jgi:hypothetical protein
MDTHFVFFIFGIVCMHVCILRPRVYMYIRSVSMSTLEATWMGVSFSCLEAVSRLALLSHRSSTMSGECW